MASVNAVMTPNPASCEANTTVREVARLMRDNDCGEIPVVDAQGKPIGVVTDRDICLRVVAHGGDGSTTAADAMSAPVRTVQADSSLRDCVTLMENARIRRVPVVDGDGKLTGIVALADIVLAGRNKETAKVIKEVSAPATN
jgi:CBS domain-containing protein